MGGTGRIFLFISGKDKLWPYGDVETTLKKLKKLKKKINKSHCGEIGLIYPLNN